MLLNEQECTSYCKFSSHADEMRAQNPCTFLSRHSTDITYHISFQIPPPSSSKVPKCHPTCFSAQYKSLPCFTKGRGFHLGVCKCIHVCAYVKAARSRLQERHDYIVKDLNTPVVPAMLTVFVRQPCPLF